MDSRPATAETKHNYQSGSWGRLSKPALTPRSSSTSLAEAPPSHSQFPAHITLLPILLPHQSSLYHAQLLHYNKLISPGRGGGGGLPVSTTSPTLAPANANGQPAPRSRSSSKVSNKDGSHKQAGAQSCHGNRAARNPDRPDRAVVTKGKESTAKMPPKQAAELSHPLPSRPAPRSAAAAAQPANPPAHHSSSVPSTPHQHARGYSYESREPSPTATQNHSPRSAYSDTNGGLPSLRPLPPRLSGCVYETALARGRRRMPYSMGSDRLDSVGPDKLKKELSPDEEARLTADMRELFARLLPTPEVEKNRTKLVQKLEAIFNDEWPGHDIRVHLFGSSGNLLCSDDSDVDICITTEWKELEGVCKIADLLARRGMEKVVCVSSAKVPIVKIWDPELGLACDMNVNNTLALENTRMVRTYVQVDDRVRQLAMIVKYWTRRRIVNDAAFGGTLSSYTWICMIICFLQLRDPPVVPALHQRPHQRLPSKDGHKSEFADDLDKLRGFGARNKESLGQLLFHFFKFYAHEFDYDKWALSARLGKLITKTDKKWHLAQNNMLCVEEPFNTVRNLGNTADDTSFRGLHIELRRAFDLIAEARLDECCAQYEFPKEEETARDKVWQKPVPRPVLLRSSSQQHASRGDRRANYRGSRHFARNGNGSRRASSSASHETNPPFLQAGIPPALTPQDLAWYQSQQAPFPFQGDMLGTLSALQMQEHSLRFQLYTQSQYNAQQQVLAHAQRMQGGGSGQTTDRSRTNSVDQPPLSAPLRPEMYLYPFPLQATPYFQPAGYTTYPSSPSAASAAPEPRRSLHRNTAAAEPGGPSGSGTPRSQSQPASRSSAAPGQPAVPGYPGSAQPSNGLASFPARQVNGIPIPSFIPDESGDSEYDDGRSKAPSDSPPEDEGARYIGYYVSDTSAPARTAAVASSIPAFGDLGQGSQGRRRLSTDQLPQSILDRRMRRASRSPSPLGHARAFSVGTSSAPLASAPFAPTSSKLGRDTRPVVVNGSAFTPPPTATSSWHPSATEGRPPDDAAYDGALHMGQQGQGLGVYVPEPLGISAPSAAAEAGSTLPERPLVVNGSSHAPETPQTAPDVQSFGQRIAAMSAFAGFPYAAPMTGLGYSGRQPFPSDMNRQRMASSRQQPNGIAPLDLAVADPGLVYSLQHLSPVYETRTPSPTALRKYEAPASHEPVPPVIAPGSHGDPRSDAAARPGQRSPPADKAAGKKETTPSSSANPRANGLAARENGHARAAKGEGEHPGGWQKPKSRKKLADLKNAAQASPLSEQLPRNEADRKGG